MNMFSLIKDLLKLKKLKKSTKQYDLKTGQKKKKDNQNETFSRLSVTVK